MIDTNYSFKGSFISYLLLCWIPKPKIRNTCCLSFFRSGICRWLEWVVLAQCLSWQVKLPARAADSWKLDWAGACAPKLTFMAAGRSHKIHFQVHSQCCRQAFSSLPYGSLQRLSECPHNTVASFPLPRATSWHGRGLHPDRMYNELNDDPRKICPHPKPQNLWLWTYL